jgi:Domain of unknown function (DUF4383)
VQKAAANVGVVILLVGVLGFISGITTNFGDLSFAGHHSDARLFRLFQVSILHNIVHLLFGITGLVMSRTATQAAPTWCLVARPLDPSCRTRGRDLCSPHCCTRGSGVSWRPTASRCKITIATGPLTRAGTPAAYSPVKSDQAVHAAALARTSQ